MSVNAVGCVKWKGHISAREAKEWKKKGNHKHDGVSAFGGLMGGEGGSV